MPNSLADAFRQFDAMQAERLRPGVERRLAGARASRTVIEPEAPRSFREQVLEQFPPPARRLAR